jgi:hypothetical protein
MASASNNDGFGAVAYHAGLTAETLAFGTGIDKSNVPTVAYDQEAGRAGDGLLRRKSEANAGQLSFSSFCTRRNAGCRQLDEAIGYSAKTRSVIAAIFCAALANFCPRGIAAGTARPAETRNPRRAASCRSG